MLKEIENGKGCSVTFPGDNMESMRELREDLISFMWILSDMANDVEGVSTYLPTMAKVIRYMNEIEDK